MVTLEELQALAKSPRRRVNTDDAAAQLGVSKRTMEEWRRSGFGPPFIKIGKKMVRYEVAELETFADSGKRRSTSDGASNGPSD